MFDIEFVCGREVLDSRGNPTVEAEVVLSGGAVGRAIVPSGASTGSREALELRDGDPDRFGGKGVLRAVEHINGPLAEAVEDLDARDQLGVDQAMIDTDGTDNKSIDGRQRDARGFTRRRPRGGRGQRSAALPVPRRLRRAGAAGADDEHPQRRRPRRQLGGLPGVHGDAGGLCRPSPRVCGPASRSSTPSRRCSPKGAACRQLSATRAVSPPTSNPTAPRSSSSWRPSTLAGYAPGDQVALAMDPAASEFFSDGTYNLTGEGREGLSSDDMIEVYASLVDDFPIVSIEDALAESDWDGWKKLIEAARQTAFRLVGDDIFVTNPEIIRRGHREGRRQLGARSSSTRSAPCPRPSTPSTWPTRRVGPRSSRTARARPRTPRSLTSRSALNTGQIKTGSACRTDRIAKYNRLLRIEEELEDVARYRGIARRWHAGEDESACP